MREPDGRELRAAFESGHHTPTERERGSIRHSRWLIKVGMPVALGRTFERSGHSYLRLVLLVTVPAIVWIGLFGLVGAIRLGRVDQSHLLMSVNQAALLIASGVLLALARLLPRLKMMLALTVILISGFGWVSSWTWTAWQSQRLGFTEFALVLALCSGIMMLVVRPVGGPLAFRPGKGALATAIIGTFFSAGAAYILIERDVIQIQERAQVQVEGLRDDVVASISSSVGAMERLAARWSTINQSIPPVFVQQEFESIASGFDEFKRLTYLDTSLATRHDMLSDKNYDGLLEKAMGSEAFKDYLEHVFETGDVHLTPVGQFLPDPKIGFIIAAISSGDSVERVVVATVNMQELATDRLDPSEVGCCYQILSNNHVLHSQPLGSDRRALAVAYESAALHHDLKMGFQYWHVDTSTRIEQPHLPEGILLFGLVFTFLANSSQRLTHVVRRRNLQLQHSALHDALTGLPNRRMLAQSLRRIKLQCERDGSSLSVVFLELDGLRLISDSLGHEAADTLLVESARRLRAALPDAAGLARLDSGDFVVFVSGLTQLEVETLTRALLAAVQEPLQVDSNQLRVTAYAGIARSTGQGQPVEPMQLVRQADMAMLKARKSGYSAWRHYTPELGEQVNARLALFNDLQTAMDKGTIQLRYQPIIDGRTGAVESFEVLMRHPHPLLGEISPGVFIPMAEESGQILPLTDWLLARACADAKRLEAAGHGDIPLAINISPRYFQSANFVERIRSALVAADLAPSRLHLEITESVLLEDAAAAINKLQHLRDMGVEAALDDFGTGYSSLAYLRQLPISAIKIDRTFVRNVISEPADAAIVRGVIAMAHHLHLKVVAEGIESIAQFSFLRRSGCDLFQGYLFDRPRLLDDILSSPATEMMTRQVPQMGTPFGVPRTRRPYAILLVGQSRWSEPFADTLRDALNRFSGEQAVTRFSVTQAISGAQALDLLAQHDVDLVIVQDSLTDIGVRSLLIKVADVHPDLVRWIHLSSLTGLQAMELEPFAGVELVHRCWEAGSDLPEMVQAIVHNARVQYPGGPGGLDRA